MMSAAGDGASKRTKLTLSRNGAYQCGGSAENIVMAINLNESK